MDADKLASLWDGLVASGRLNEIRDEAGNIRPSDTAIVKTEIEYSDFPVEVKQLFARTQTLVDLAEIYKAQLDAGPGSELATSREQSPRRRMLTP